MQDVEIINSLQIKPDYVGFVFAESRRKVTLKQAAELRDAISHSVIVVGVFVNEPIINVHNLAKSGIIDMIQLHGNEDDEYIRTLTLQTDKKIIRAVKTDSPQGSADFLLFDSPSPGSGRTFDWGTLPSVTTPYFLAGGLNPDNVAEAIRRVSPYAVDVSSGVEVDGFKDRKLIERFISEVINK